MRNTPFAICIVGKDQVSCLEECIGQASKVTHEILYLDLGSKDGSAEKAVELGAIVIKAENSLEDTGKLINEATSSNWLLFQRPDEKIGARPTKIELDKLLKNKDVDAYAVTTKNTVKYDILEPFQLIKKLDQFKNIKDSVYVSEFQIRLVRRKYTTGCLDFVINSSVEKLAEVRNKIVDDLIIESIQPMQKDEPLSEEDHDLKCLKGEINYDVARDEDMVELSEAYTGFRVLHKGYLDSFINGAKLGFGNMRMYIPMLQFLVEHGYFKEAQNLFECWVQNRSEEEIYNTNVIGGMIYSNLLHVDSAIKCYERIIALQKSSLALANLGKLYLLKGKREKAIEYLKQVEDVKGDIFLKDRILSIIDNTDWKSVTLSLCMIARDEENDIRQALESVQGIADEVIVVDTGSSDRTKEIVREFGGKVVEMVWKDDFSAARNRCLQEATCDYVLCMDADEYIDPRHRFPLAMLKKLLPAGKDMAFVTKIELPQKEKALSIQAWLDTYKEYEIVEYQTRLFPGKAGIQYKGALFESTYESLRHLGLKLAANDMLRITHNMDNRTYREKRKAPAALKSFSSIGEPEKLVEGGLLFLRLGDLDRAYPWFEKSERINPQLASKIALLYSRQGENNRAKVIIEKALEYFPESIDLALAMAEICHKEGQYSEVVKLLAGKIEAIEKNLEPEDAARAVYYHGIASLETGNLGDGIEYLAFAHEKNPANILYKIAGIYAFSKVDQWEQALQAAAQIAKEEEIDIPDKVNDFVDVGKIFMAMNRHFTGTGKTEEANLCQKILEDIVKTKISGEENIQRMSAVIEGIGSHG